MLILGLAIGYSFGAHNQLYYDAPAKISLYSTVIEKGKSEEYLKGQISSQARLLNQPGFELYRSELLLMFPPHGSSFKSNYYFYNSRIKDKKKYQEALESICDLSKEDWACR